MEIGASGQNGEPVRRTGHVNEAKIHAQEVATILLLLMGGATALAVVLKLKVLFIQLDLRYYSVKLREVFRKRAVSYVMMLNQIL